MDNATTLSRLVLELVPHQADRERLLDAIEDVRLEEYNRGIDACSALHKAIEKSVAERADA